MTTNKLLGDQVNESIVLATKKPLHVGVAIALAASCTTAANFSMPIVSWFPQSVMSAIPLLSSRSEKINKAINDALTNAFAMKQELLGVIDWLSKAESIDGEDLSSHDDLTAKLSELLATAKSINVRPGINEPELKKFVRVLAEARSLSLGIDKIRGQFVAPKSTYVSNISREGMRALSNHAWGLSLGT